MQIQVLPHVFLLTALVACGATSVALPAATTAAAPPTTPAPTTASPPAGFERVVRADYFRGIAGDDVAFARAMKACDDALAVNPDDAQPLVWRGAGRLFEAAKAFRAGDTASGRTLFAQAVGEMDRAVALAPDDLGVRIPRASTVLGFARYVKDEARARPLVERGVADYHVVLARQEGYLGELTLHAREELLFGLADGEARLGHPEEARVFFERLVAACPESTLAPYARAWLAGSPPADRPACNGCHGG